MATALDPSQEAVREMALAATEWLMGYYTSLLELPWLRLCRRPTCGKVLAGPLPVEGHDFASLLDGPSTV